MRVAVGGLMHETNTFARETTALADFQAYQFAVGKAIYGFRGVKNEVGGFLDGCEEQGWEVVPSLYGVALPGGLVDHDVFEALVDRMVGELSSYAKPDGVLLALHGAMVTTRSNDADGELLARVASHLGPDVPIVTTIDFHANTTDAMTRHVDALIGYDTYPHVDMYQRGREAVTVLADVLRGGARRAVVHRKVGLITPPQAQYSDAEPVRSIMERVHAFEAAEGVSVSVTPGFPYADIDSLGLSVVASSSDPLCAKQVADLVAADVESHGDEFHYTTYSVAEAVDRALRVEGPVALVDSADNVGGGSPGDGTAILAEWFTRGGSGLVVSLTDEEAVRACNQAGVGATAHLSVGGKTDDRHGSPVELTGSVRMLADGHYVHRGSYATGITTHMGRTAVVESLGNTVVLTEKRVMPFDAQQWLSLGISPAYCRAFVVKSAVAWRAAYGDYPREVIDVDAPGICSGNLQRLNLSGQRTRMFRPRGPSGGTKQ
jgi:microcystin degradation protein MlrC